MPGQNYQAVGILMINKGQLQQVSSLSSIICKYASIIDYPKDEMVIPSPVLAQIMNWVNKPSIIRGPNPTMYILIIMEKA